MSDDTDALMLEPEDSPCQLVCSMERPLSPYAKNAVSAAASINARAAVKLI